jgi:hypothetical protein
MSDANGLLSTRERAVLVGEEGTEAERAALCDELQDRLQATLLDVAYLYSGLRDEDLAAVFDPDDQVALSQVRASTQEALTLLVMGMQQNDDGVKMRLREALKYAAAAQSERADVNLEITRESMADAEHYLRRAEQDSLDEPSLLELEALLYDEKALAETVAAVFTAVGIEMSTEKVEAARNGAARRIPQAVVTDIEVREGEDPRAEDGVN